MIHPGVDERAAMFSRIAKGYDRINAVLSWGLIGRWRRALLRRLPHGWRPGSILDVCCGTGAMTALLAETYPEAGLFGVDFAPGMLCEAAARFARTRGPSPRFVLADQNDLPFADASFDLVVNAFGLRNSVSPERSLAEMLRVLQPGGFLALLELTRPEGGILDRLFSLYFLHLTPLLAGLLGGDAAAYRYLPASVAGFRTRMELAAALAGLSGGAPAVTPLFVSLVTLYLLRSPERRRVE
ncbi:MAG: ubiquinone/menaquinone biosynthesis methyltransferase [Firmicutes bacterium]|nr:ubiquinone/menaquinone biosynthesis methyltransferase [Bacillota bacterium]